MKCNIKCEKTNVLVAILDGMGLDTLGISFSQNDYVSDIVNNYQQQIKYRLCLLNGDTYLFRYLRWKITFKRKILDLLYTSQSMSELWDASPTMEVPCCAGHTELSEWSPYLSVCYGCSLHCNSGILWMIVFTLSNITINMWCVTY
jgi:hypothetical protein